ncbi:hypothetical protein [Chryseosolibacter indicus]|uniref:DUF4421 domain-containing protein n=1 Tax=Chryseosolibacter indicus TaxID=2782351 RepID=A0ABS5VLP8_9BACT|nr:hypothetical protein [Chryseosolibacter indicus]MBT1701750.1 hypothetical protein [Chryseosolibacter indicus]
MRPRHSIFLRLIILALLASFISNRSSAQYKKEQDATIPLDYFYIEKQNTGALRNLLSKVHWGLSTGYASTAFKHDLAGFGIRQRTSSSLPEIFNSGNTSAAYSNWINNVVPSDTIITSPVFAVDSDTTALGFRSSTSSILLKATVHVEINRFRIGGGYSFDYTRIGDFKPTAFKDDINPYSLEKKGIFMKHYFAMIGASVYRYYDYLFVVDANIGGYSMGKSFNKSLMQKGVYINLGVTIEREMSEYFKLFVRPSYEIKGYKLSIPETNQEISHRLNAFYVNIGATYRLPEIRRCFLKSCHAQINHAHGNKIYRSRRHPIYKKQNPHYGENYPNLLKYKGKNKNKLNPY